MTVVDNHRPRLASAIENVSILVLVDDGRRLQRKLVELRKGWEFQSLFLWMTVVDPWSWRAAAGMGRVSILVLVDDGRRQYCCGRSSRRK